MAQGAVSVRRDFPAFMAGDIKTIFDDYTGDLEEQFTNIYQIETSDKAYELELGYVGLGTPGLVAELQPNRLDAPKQGRPVTYINNKYGLSVAFSFESREDDRYGKLSRSLVPELANSFKVERNTQAANLLNNAFTLQGYEPDGVPLCAANHPTVRGDYLLSNLLTLPLSVAGLQAGRALLRKVRAESGKIMPYFAERLFVGPSQQSLAEEITSSTMKPGQTVGTTTVGAVATQPNEVNLPAIRRLEVDVLDYLRDDGAYFVAAPKAKRRMKWFERKKLYSKPEIDDRAEAVYLHARARWSLGFSDWRGICGFTPTGV